MVILRVIAAILAAAVGLQAQGQVSTTPEAAIAAAVASLEERQTVQRLSQVLRTLQTNMKVSENVKAEVDKLAAEARLLLNAGNASESRRLILHTIAVQRGLPWNETTEFTGSLLLYTSTVVADSSRTFYARLAQGYAAPCPSLKNGLRLHATLADFAAPGKVVRDLGTVAVFSRDLLDDPYAFSASLEGLADGPYQMAVELADGDQVLCRLTINILTVRDLESQRSAIEARLAKIKGFEGTKATIRYPFDYARVINLGRRDLIPGRNPEDNVNNDYFDFSAEIRNSMTILRSLESGKDPLLKIKGEHERHYFFTDAGEIMPYRVFVPSKYTDTTRLPLVVVLHGSGADQDTYFKRRGPVLTTEAEKHGFIIVTPLGYRPTGGWGRSGAPGGPPGGATARAGGAPAPADRGRQLASELSEKDALNVIEMVANEYGVDRSRMYLMGNSMGGSGTWYLGTKFAERWAAIAPAAATSVGEGFRTA